MNQVQLMKDKPVDGFVLGYIIATGNPFTITYDEALRHILILGSNAFEMKKVDRLLAFQQIFSGGGLISIDGKPYHNQLAALKEYASESSRAHEVISLRKIDDMRLVEDKKIIYTKVNTEGKSLKDCKACLDLGGIASLISESQALHESQKPHPLLLTLLDDVAVSVCKPLSRMLEQARSARFALCLSSKIEKGERLECLAENTWTKIFTSPLDEAELFSKKLTFQRGETISALNEFLQLKEGEAFVKTGDGRLEKINIPTI